MVNINGEREIGESALRVGEREYEQSYLEKRICTVKIQQLKANTQSKETQYF